MGIRLRDLFDIALATKRLRREYWTTDELLSEVERVFPILAAANERVTQQMIADEIGVPVSTLGGHPKIRQRLSEIAALYIWTEDELLTEVNRVFLLLAASNERVTQQMIADEIGVTHTTLKRYPKVRQRLSEIAALYIWTEDELLTEVNRAFPHLATANQRVTQPMIADEIGVARTTLKYYPKVRQRIAEIAALYIWTDDELLSEVERVFPLLAAVNEHVTQQMIADEIGVTIRTLTGHEKVRQRLAEIAPYAPWATDELLAEVNRVFPILAASNERVTHQMIADEIGVTVNTLRGHKKVEQRLAEITALYTWTEDELLAEVNRVFPILAASNERVTQQMIADEIGVTRATLKGHKKVRQRLAEITALYTWTDDELLAEVERAFLLLAAANKRVTQRMIAEAIGVTRGVFIGREKVQQRLAQIAALYR